MYIPSSEKNEPEIFNLCCFWCIIEFSGTHFLFEILTKQKNQTYGSTFMLINTFLAIAHFIIDRTFRIE